MLIRMLIRRRRITVPIGFGAWVLYMVFVLASFTALESSGPPFAYLWRLANFVSCTIFFLAICDATEEEISADRIVRLLAGFWLITLLGGWLGVLMPYGGLPSLTEKVLPAAQELAARLAAGPTVAYAQIKAELSVAATATLAESLEREAEAQAIAGATHDHTAATMAFGNKT